MDEQAARLALIRNLETLATNAWPAAEVSYLGGWRLRFTDGVTRRANSVWPNQPLAGADLDETLAEVEAFYAARREPPRYQLSPASAPADLDARLAARGYRSVARTAVQAVALPTIFQQTKPLRLLPTFEVELSEGYDEAWFVAYAAVEHADDAGLPIRRAILQRIAAQTAYASLRIDGSMAAVGLGVLEGAWLGVFCMATAPAFRRRGAAAAILRTLAIWAQLYDAHHAYLQVMDDNAPARALYAGAGFQTLYHYHYREK
ncbi:MAG: GNAT family N-acetyltransferase [Caldilineaceae bacterium]|nr:GNAT family N-acetyltransferase [Caldilineaceae bacterium]